MTISVAKFVAAPAANPAATAISGTAGQADSILAGDFANLLLGQLAGEQLASDSAMAGKTGKEFAAEGTDGMAVTDSAQLFAALGSSSSDNGPTGTGAHTDKKTMGAGARGTTGLKSSFTHNSYPL